MQASKVSNADLDAFMAAAQEKTQLKLGHELGQKYARVFIREDTGRRIFCFVDLTTGNVLRSDGWKRPNLKVKNSVLGNVFDEHKGCGPLRAGDAYPGCYSATR